MKSVPRALLPLISGLLILTAAGILIHLYRSTYLPGPVVSPALPRAQFSFSVSLPDNPGQSDRTLLLRIVKNKSAFLSVNYWHIGRTVLQIPVLDLPQATSHNKIRLSLWDPGTYTLSFSDAKSGEPVQSTTIHIATPLGLYRNDVFLLLALAILGYVSGRMALGSFIPSVHPWFSRIFASRKLLFSGLLAVSLLLVLSVGLPRTAPPVHEQVREGFHESEGRLDAARMPLLSFQTEMNERSGYLVLRHRLDSWLRFGQDLTLFEGPVSLDPKYGSYILPPDDGRYRMTLWAQKSGTLVPTHRTLRAIPVSPPFPLSLFLGLSLFSGAFFLLGLLRQGTELPHASEERVH
jgi:hypothetical protein